ncbi:MAG: sterol desaturase family protein [Planctomycetes bacterium]|nr:sterol desaturase family protein [Planctomycetota bacterium]
MGLEYWQYLILVSVAFAIWEKLQPWHRPHRLLRRGWLRDLGFLAFNGHVFKAMLVGGYLGWLYRAFVDLVQRSGITVEARVGADWPLWLHVVAFLVLSDFVEWCTHNLLHRVPWLWTFHKVHHAIPRLDWAANFHFHWMEILIYSTTKALPLAWLGVPPDAVFWIYVLPTAWGHFNHANVPVGIGPLRFVFNSPRMHQWHHDASAEGGVAKNFGIVLSVWDWLFGTAYWPRDREPERLGYPGDEEMPQHFGGQMVWPLRWLD